MNTWDRRRESRDAKIDRAFWEAGPWDNEPDRIEWSVDGAPCLMIRNSFGAWCGYVDVPAGHPLHGLDYNAAYEHLTDGVHCGLTYACDEGSAWRFGFDCCHAGDLAPGLRATASAAYRRAVTDDIYRDVAFVRAEAESLATQLAAVANVQAVSP